MSVEAVARKWHDQFLRTDPIDHETAEAALRNAYRAAGIAEPGHFLWCSSPAEAAWAYLVLVGKTEGYNHAVYQDVERSKGGKEALAGAKASVAGKLGIEGQEVEGYFGKPFYVAEGSNPISKKLQENFDAWMARAEAGDDFLAIHKQGPFKPLHDLEQVLHFEGERRGAGSLFKEALARSANKHLAILGGRSALHRLYGSFAYSEVALDEALAGLGRFEPTDLQRTMWAAYEATGMWWPCEKGVVLAERPAVAEQTGDSVALRWADGFTVGVVSGEPQAPSAPPPQTGAPKAAEPASIFAQPLPALHTHRIAALRAAGPLPLFDRYLAGEREQVWQDLVALGEAARADAHAADALAVAYETMHRVEQNVRTLAQRLKSMGYRLVYPGSTGLLGLRKATAHEPRVPPPADASARVAELQEVAGGAIPLSLRAFFEVVGEVNLNGSHPSLAPAESDVAPDPLMVCGIEEAIAMIESSDRDDDGPLLLDFAPDALHKANVSGGDPYAIALPNSGADARVEDAPEDSLFVEYLRIAILDWGGFPGWRGHSDPPPDLDRLRDGLIPF